MSVILVSSLSRPGICRRPRLGRPHQIGTRPGPDGGEGLRAGSRRLRLTQGEVADESDDDDNNNDDDDNNDNHHQTEPKNNESGIEYN